MSRYPAHCPVRAIPDSRRDIALDGFPFVWFSLPVATLQSGLRDFASANAVCVVTMVLSEARGLSLFLIIRGGIACKWVTRCRSRHGPTH